MNPNQQFNWTGAGGFAQGPLTRNPRQAPPPQHRIPDTRSTPQIPYRNVVRQEQPNQFYDPMAHAGTGTTQMTRNNGVPRQAPPPQNRTHSGRPMAQQATVMYAPLNGIGTQAHSVQHRSAQARAETPSMTHQNVPGPSNGMPRTVRRPAPPPPCRQNPGPSGMAQSTQMAHEYRQSATPAGLSYQQTTRQQIVAAQDEKTYCQGPLMPTSRPVQSMSQPLLPQGPPQLPHHRQPQQQQQQQGQGVPRDDYMAEYFKSQQQNREAAARRNARELKKKEDAERKAAESRRKREEEQKREQRRRAQFQAKYNSSDMNNMWIYGADTNHQSTSARQDFPVVSDDCFQVEDTEEVVGDGSEEQNRQHREEEMGPSTSNSGQMSELDQVKLFISGQRRKDPTDQDEDDAEIMRRIMEASSNKLETKEDILEGIKTFEEERKQKEQEPASVDPSLPRRSATSVQPPSISPNSTQALSLEGTRQVPPNQVYTSPQAPPSLASTSGQSGINVTPPAHVTPPNPQMFPNMTPPTFQPPPYSMPQHPGQFYPQFPSVDFLMRENENLKLLVQKCFHDFHVMVADKDAVIKDLSQRLATAEDRNRQHGDLVENGVANKRRRMEEVRQVINNIKVEPEEEEEVDVNSQAVQQEASVQLMRRQIKKEMREQNPQVAPQEIEGIIVDRIIPPENRKFRNFDEAVAFWRERFPPNYFEMKLQAKGIFNLGFKFPELRYFFRPSDSHNPLPQLVKQPFVYPKLDYKALAALDKQIPPWDKEKKSDVLWKAIMGVVSEVQMEQNRAGLVHWLEKKEKVSKKRGRPAQN